MVMESRSVTSRPSLENLHKLNATKQLQIIRNLTILWEEVGIDEEQKLNRATQIWNFIFELLYDIELEEVSLVDEIKERIKNYEKKISVLNAELQLPKAEKVTGCLIQKEQTLRQLLDQLTKMKDKLMKEFKELHMEGLKYSKILGTSLSFKLSSQTEVPTKEDIYILQQQVNALKEEEVKRRNEHRLVKEFDELRLQGLKYSEILETPTLNFECSSTTGIPAIDDIRNLQQQVTILQQEKEKRQQHFFKLKKELSTILEITELSSEISLRIEVLNQQKDSQSLSIAMLKELEQIVAEAKKQQADLQNERASLMEKLSMLWERLEINAKERQLFLLKHTDCCISSLNALKEEIARCEKVQKQNLSKYTSSLKEQLVSVWNKCFILPLEHMLHQIQEDKINKTVLENCNNEIKKWENYYKDVEHIIQMITKRQKLWDQMMIFENKAADPNRYKNRGGNLLKEEKERKQLQKTLPELEEKIIVNIKSYEKETGKQFLYYGEKFEGFMKKQWEDRINQKENKRLTKKKMRLEELRTPSKQSFSTLTPKSTPNKVLRTTGTFIFKTPNLISKQSTHNPISSVKHENKASNKTKRSKRSILKENNKNELISKFLDSTSYEEFTSKLNRPSRIHHRSSVLSSKGSRSSLNKKKSLRKT